MNKKVEQAYQIAKELVRSGQLEKVHIGLDTFDVRSEFNLKLLKTEVLC